jgi:hypothetical protein
MPYFAFDGSKLERTYAAWSSITITDSNLRANEKDMQPFAIIDFSKYTVSLKQFIANN